MEPLTLVALGVAAVVVALLVARRSVSPAPPQTGLLKPSIFKPTPEMKISTKATGRRYLVVGGSGFLGSHIVEALLARGEQHVRIFDQRDTPLFKDHPKVEFVLGNILNKDDCKKAVKGIDSVFHTAAVIDYWSRFDFQRPLSYAVNVTGLENVLAASIAEGVKRFVYTSSSNVILGSGESIINGDESWPYPARPNNHYSETKALAEKAVLAANGKNGILTGAVRPNGIFGPRDNLMAESVYRAGKPEPMLCKGNLQDWVYVENVVHAQLLLEGALSDSSSSPAGKTYCIAGDRPMEYIEFWTKLNRAVGGKDEDIVVLPKPLVWTLAIISESLTWLSRGNLKGQFFKLTPAVLTIAMADIYLNYSRAKKDFGYEPPYTMEEAFAQCSHYYQPGEIASSQKKQQ